MFNGIALSCTRSRRSVDRWSLKILQMQAKERQKKAAKPSEERSTSIPTIASASQNELPIHSISCGLWRYTLKDGHPLFLTYRKWKVTGTIKFTSRKIIIKTDKSQRIDLLCSNIEELVLSGVPDPGVTITCREAPMFFRTGPNHQQTDLLQSMQRLGLAGR